MSDPYDRFAENIRGALSFRNIDWQTVLILTLFWVGAMGIDWLIH